MYKILWGVVAIGAGLSLTVAAQPMDGLVIYPAPTGAILSTQYVVKVNGKPVDVYIAPVWDPPGQSNSFGGPYSFAYFDFAGSVNVEITTVKPLDRVRILPESRGIKPILKGGTLSFAINKPGQFSIEPDAKNGPLLLFANPLEKNPPKQGGPGVIYFGPGLHNPGEIKLQDNQTLYIAGGAVVQGGVKAQGTNIRIAGRGILDGLAWAPKKGPTNGILNMPLCTNAIVEGIIVKDAWDWTLVLRGCRNVQIDNIKICSARCGNNDGIDVVNSQQVKIENCFIRSDDDCITTKGYGWPACKPDQNGVAVEDVTASHCIFWTDRAHIWRLGSECWAEAMRRLSFRDIDVLHWDGPRLLTLEAAEGMPMEDILFEDIRVNGAGQSEFIEVNALPTMWIRRFQTPGSVLNLTFKNIAVTGPAPGDTGMIRITGGDITNIVEGVTFDSVLRYGARVTRDSPGIQIQSYTTNIVFK